MKRSGIKRGTKGLERRTRLRPVSQKRRAELAKWAAVKADTLMRDAGICQAAHLVPQVACWGPLDPHHIAKRSTTPQARLDPDNIVWLCRRHHDMVDLDQLAAQRLGLHRPSWEYKATG
jgi:hypothetical protein